MKKLAYYFSAALLGATVLFSSCKKTEDPTPDNNPEAKVFTSTMTATNYGNTGAAIAVGTVTTSDGTVKLRLDVTHSGTNNLSKIFIMKSEDNDAFSPIPFSDNITTSDNKTFSGGSDDYTFDIPSGTKSFVLDVPVPVRTTSAAVTDVYQIWVTDGPGGFNKPTKNRVLGPATITLNYVAGASASTFATETVNLGSQSSNDYGSLLVTSGQIAAHLTADYNDAPGSSDIRFVTLNGSGKKDNNATNLYLYSPADIEDANPAVSPQDDFVLPTTGTSRTTTFTATAITSLDFDNVTAADISGLTVGSATNVQVVAGSVYAFETESGKKGLIKINSAGATTNFVGTGSTTARNINITVKILN